MIYAVILSGGIGVRLGGIIPKQYIEINGSPIIKDCIDVFEASNAICGYVIVATNEWQDYVKNIVGSKFISFGLPGENRQLSIYNGLLKLNNVISEDDIVIIHDAVRPFVTVKIIDDLIDACENADGAMPALSVKDTMYIQENGKVKALIDRNSIIAGQAPEAFRYGKYLRANEALMPEKIKSIKGSTEPAYLAGMNVMVIPGDESNFKITTREDLDNYIRLKR